MQMFVFGNNFEVIAFIVADDFNLLVKAFFIRSSMAIETCREVFVFVFVIIFPQDFGDDSDTFWNGNDLSVTAIRLLMDKINRRIFLIAFVFAADRLMVRFFVTLSVGGVYGKLTHRLHHGLERAHLLGLQVLMDVVRRFLVVALLRLHSRLESLLTSLAHAHEMICTRIFSLTRIWILLELVLTEI